MISEFIDKPKKSKMTTEIEDLVGQTGKTREKLKKDQKKLKSVCVLKCIEKNVYKCTQNNGQIYLKDIKNDHINVEEQRN